MMCQRFMRMFLRFGAAGLKVVTNGSISFVCFVAKSLLSVRELNFTQNFLNEFYGIASLTYPFLKFSFVFFKVFFD